MARSTLVFGVTYHGSTQDRLKGLDNAFGKHISAARLRQHLSWFKERFTVMGMSDILERIRAGKLPPKRALFIVFHDGYRGNYDVAFPLLKEHGLKAAFFLTTGLIGSQCRFWVDMLDAALKHSPCEDLRTDLSGRPVHLSLKNGTDREAASLQLRSRLTKLKTDMLDNEFQRICTALGFPNQADIPRLGDHEACMTWDMVREMGNHGMEFGAHTHNHTICAQQDEATVISEMTTSKAILERETGRECRLFCYPNGRYPHDGNDKTDRLALEAGYKNVLYMEGPYNLVHPGIFRLTGIAYGESAGYDELQRTLSEIRYYKMRLLGRKIWPWSNNRLD